MMEYGGDDEFKAPQQGKRKQYEVDHESLSQSAVEKLMADDVEYVCSVCGVDVGIYLSDDLNSNSASVQESMASLMLRHSKWNKERLIEKYMDNPTSLLVAAGVIIPEPTSFATTRTRTSDFSPSTTSSSRRSSRGASRLLITLVGGSKTKSPITSPTLTHYTPRSLKYKSFDSSEKICLSDLFRRCSDFTDSLPRLRSHVLW